MKFYKCKECRGSGRVLQDIKFIELARMKTYQRKVLCPICEGSGKVSWIDNIFMTNSTGPK